VWRLNGGLLLASHGISLLSLFFAFRALFLVHSLWLLVRETLRFCIMIDDRCMYDLEGDLSRGISV